MLVRRQILLLLAIFFIFSGCKKEEDQEPPTISWNSPTENENFSVREEIFVEATINDNEKVKSASLGLYSVAENRLIQTPMFFTSNENELKIATNFNIKDSLLNSGEYYFSIEAEDDNNIQASFRFINIAGIQRKRLGILVACGNQNASQFYLDENSFVFSQIYQSSSPYIGSAINHIDQQYWTILGRNDKINVFHLNERAIVFEEIFNSNFPNLFTDINIHDRIAFTSNNRGEVRGFDEQFSTRFNYIPARSERTVQSIRAGNEFILAYEQDITGKNKSIQIIFRGTGALRSEIFIDHDVVSIHTIGPNDALLFQNDEDGGMIGLLNISEDAQRTLSSSIDSVLCVEQIDESHYLISTVSGIIIYDYSNNTSIDFIDISHSILSFDDLNSEVFIAKGSLLSVYTYPSATLIDQHDFGMTIKGIDVWYNR